MNKHYLFKTKNYSTNAIILATDSVNQGSGITFKSSTK